MNNVIENKYINIENKMETAQKNQDGENPKNENRLHKQTQYKIYRRNY